MSHSSMSCVLLSTLMPQKTVCPLILLHASTRHLCALQCYFVFSSHWSRFTARQHTAPHTCRINFPTNHQETSLALRKRTGDQKLHLISYNWSLIQGVSKVPGQLWCAITSDKGGPFFVIFFTVKFIMDLWRKFELKHSPPLKSVAALPCEK